MTRSSPSSTSSRRSSSRSRRTSSRRRSTSSSAICSCSRRGSTASSTRSSVQSSRRSRRRRDTLARLGRHIARRQPLRGGRRAYRAAAHPLADDARRARARPFTCSRCSATSTSGSSREPDCPDEVVWDPERINEVTGNLLSNAFKFTPRGGQVELTAAPHENGVRMTVRDTGAGIPPEQLHARVREVLPGGQPEVGVREGHGAGTRHRQGDRGSAPGTHHRATAPSGGHHLHDHAAVRREPRRTSGRRAVLASTPHEAIASDIARRRRSPPLAASPAAARSVARLRAPRAGRRRMAGCRSLAGGRRGRAAGQATASPTSCWPTSRCAIRRPPRRSSRSTGARSIDLDPANPTASPRDAIALLDSLPRGAGTVAQHGRGRDASARRPTALDRPRVDCATRRADLARLRDARCEAAPEVNAQRTRRSSG